MLAIIFHIPFGIYCAREQLYQFYKMERSSRGHFCSTLIFSVIAIFAPCFYPDIIDLLGLVSGIILCTAGPGMVILLKIVNLTRKKKKKLKLIFYSILFCLVEFLGAASSIISILKRFKKI